MKAVSIVGARPQFIKAKPIIDEFKRKTIEHVLVHTGQHYAYEMSKIFFDELSIPEPDYNLEVGSYTHGKQTAVMLERIEKVLLKEKPDITVVYGDTNSTLAGALAAAKMNISIAHIEAGLRSYRLDMPEEINRVLTDHISDYLFCPTETAVRNLRNEGFKNIINNGKLICFPSTRSLLTNYHLPIVVNVGDIMHDIFKSKIKNLNSEILQKLNLKSKEYLLLTVHRQGNTNNIKNLKLILFALRGLKEKVVFPIHPRTRKILRKVKNFKMEDFKNLLPIKPASYLDMLTLEKNAKKILTDSGGVQKEAYWFGVPCITLRNETEWVETIEDGHNVLAGADKERIIELASNFVLDNRQSRAIFGDGKAAEKAINVIRNKIV